jgi:next-to-BRCA1 protein 1
LVRDVTLPDGARVRPGASLTKVWRLQNSGSAVWPTGSTLGFVGGSDFGAVPTAIPDNVEPGAMIDVTLRCTAPQRAGRYIGYWRLIDPRGSPYGERIWLDVDVDGVADNVAAPATAPVVVQAPVIAPPADESWTALAKAIEASNEKERRQEKERLAREAKEERERREAEARRQAEQERARREAEQLEQARALAAAQQQKQKAGRGRCGAGPSVWRKVASALAMGFTGDHVRVLIAKHNGNVLAVVQELLEDTNAV